MEIDFCGVCHSDLHSIDNDWKYSVFPLVAGHEIVGRVVAKGADVRDREIGTRVGIGPQRSVCGLCVRASMCLVTSVVVTHTRW